ncbi:MAG: hypothetical protein PVG81_13625 [Desulfobacterales bacterium]
MMRSQPMLREEAVTPQEFDTVAARHRQAQAALTQAGSTVAAARSRVQQARAAVAAASVTHKDAVINAAYDGIMVDKLVEVGDLAAPPGFLQWKKPKRKFQFDDDAIPADGLSSEPSAKSPDHSDCSAVFH